MKYLSYIFKSPSDISNKMIVIDYDGGIWEISFG